MAQKQHSLGIPARICSGEASELLDAWRGADDVLVVDAVVTGAPVGTVHRWGNPQSIPFAKSAGSTHGFGLAEAIALAVALKQLPARLWIYGIESKNFQIGAGISPEVGCAVDEVVNAIQAEVKVKH